MAEKFNKGADKKGMKKKPMMKATIMAEDAEGLGEGARTLSEMMLGKWKEENDHDEEDD